MAAVRMLCVWTVEHRARCIGQVLFYRMLYTVMHLSGVKLLLNGLVGPQA